jgi:hypothetical protein
MIKRFLPYGRREEVGVSFGLKFWPLYIEAKRESTHSHALFTHYLAYHKVALKILGIFNPYNPFHYQLQAATKV